MALFSDLKHYMLNLPGWHTKRKIVVIHSDDWGSIRMPSTQICEQLNKFADIHADDPYCRYDTLASAQDLEALFEVLQSVKDKNGRPAVLTANCLMANPDFDRIREAKFETYYYEIIDKTFSRYNNDGALKLWQEGYDIGLFIPQFHGREHVNVPFWMQKLKEGHKGVRRAFDLEVFGVSFRDLGLRKNNFQAAWDFNTLSEKYKVSEIIRDGLTLFEKYFHRPSTTAIAPSYVWNEEQEMILFNSGVKAMQGIPFQQRPTSILQPYRKKFRYTIMPANNNMGYQIRNVFFEPSLTNFKDLRGEVLNRIDIAFKMKKPAIIASHRLNFIGKLNERNRSDNLKELRHILLSIVNKWPDIEFMSSSDLTKVIADYPLEMT